MNIISIGVIIIMISLLIILFYLLSINKNTKKISTEENIKNIDINSIMFPKNIENLNAESLQNASKVIFESYKSLGYVNKLPSSLDKIEWHTWQVSILLVFLRNKTKILILEKNEYIFNNVILELNEATKNKELQKIYNKYLNRVNIYKNRDNLSRDVIWTAREVSIIFYKIINKS